MKTKVQLKNLYLIAIIAIGLIGLGVGSTFAMFTASTSIDNPIAFSSNLSSTNNLAETIEVVVPAGEDKNVDIVISNTSSGNLNYTAWYSSTSNDLLVGSISSNEAYGSVGTIPTATNFTLTVQLRNSGDTPITVTIGVSSSGSSVILPNGVTQIPSGSLPVYAVEYITNLYTEANRSTTTVNSITYSLAPSVGLMRDQFGSSSSTSNTGNLRYYGADPNNYVDIGQIDTKPWEKWDMFKGMFENSQQCYATADCETNYAMIGQLIDMDFTSAAQCEAAMPSILANAGVSSIDEICGEQPILYRIIGVFGGRLKLITADSIGSYSWDTSADTVNSGYGINQWGPSGSYEGSDLMRLLNPGYESTSVNNSLYWNSESGSCYNEFENSTTECDFTYNGLKAKQRNMIDTVTWYTGAYDNYSYVDAHYSAERGSLGKICTQGTMYCTDTVERTSSWNGKVGLISVSDYGYAADLSQCNQTLDNYSNCTSSNWLKSNNFYRTMSPRAYSAYAYGVFTVSGDGNLGDGGASDDSVVRPAVFLKSGVTIDTEGRDGSQSNPYVLSY